MGIILAGLLLGLLLGLETCTLVRQKSLETLFETKLRNKGCKSIDLISQEIRKIRKQSDRQTTLFEKKLKCYWKTFAIEWFS